MTNDKENPELRDKDIVVLQSIQDGKDDTHKITQATTLENHEVRYSLKKLEELGLLDVEKPDGMVERVVNGQKRVFKAPLKARMTDFGDRTLVQNEEDIEQYETLSRAELVVKVRELESEVNSLRQTFDIFRQQIQRQLD